MTTGQTIAALRTGSGITQEQLAAELFVSRDLVSKWETGKSLPDYRTLVKLAEKFSVSVDVLFDKDQALKNELASCIPAGRELDPARLKAAINVFLATLSVRDRAVFIRRYYFFEDAAAIGDEYGLRQSSVRTILLRTRKKLKKYFN